MLKDDTQTSLRRTGLRPLRKASKIKGNGEVKLSKSGVVKMQTNVFSKTSVLKSLNCFVPYSFKSTKTSTSLRTQVAAKYLCSNERTGDVLSKSRRRNLKKRNQLKQKRLDKLVQYSGPGVFEVSSSLGTLCNGGTFYISEDVKSMYNVGGQNCTFHHYSPSTFKLVDDSEGCIHYLSNGEVAFIKVPRKYCIRSVSKFGPADADVFKSCIKGRKSTVRGVAMSDTFNHGHMVQRGAIGIRLSREFGSNEKLYKKLNHMLKRIDNACSAFFPPGLLLKFRRVCDEICPFPTLRENGFSCSVSVAVDHISAVHVDKDFFFSYLTARSEFQGDIDWNSSFHAATAYHFMFPSIGYGVCVRPGDILIFNPTIPHCCSHKLSAYDGIPVYLSSFYVKTAHVGGNNNGLSLTKEQETILMS